MYVCTCGWACVFACMNLQISEHKHMHIHIYIHIYVCDLCIYTFLYSIVCLFGSFCYCYSTDRGGNSDDVADNDDISLFVNNEVLRLPMQAFHITNKRYCYSVTRRWCTKQQHFSPT